MFELEPVAGKKVTVDFSAPKLSSLGGLSLVREYEKSSNSIIASYNSEPDSIIIGADNTNADTYGAQQLTL